MILRGGWSRRVRALLAGLETDRQSIRRGDLRGLAEAAARREAALSELLESGPAGTAEAEADLRRLRRAAARNARLLEALRAGAAAAVRDLARQSEAAERLGYGRDGAPVGRARAPARDRRA